MPFFVSFRTSDLVEKGPHAGAPMADGMRSGCTELIDGGDT